MRTKTNETHLGVNEMGGMPKHYRNSRRPLNAFTLSVASLALVSAGLPDVTMAQRFPAKLIRMVVPVAAGGTQDIVARTISQKLTEQLGQQVIVENRPSASSIVGTEFVAKAPPDGYTYLAISNTFASTPAVMRKVSYDPIKDFTGVSITALLPQILDVNPHIPANNVKELIALAKRRPNELTYGSAGVGAAAHLAAELFSHQAGIKMTHVAYKGNAPALIDVVGGQISLIFDTLNTSVQYVKAGKLKALGVTGPKRSPVFPQLPTISEAGLPGYQTMVFNAVLAPAGTPRDILARMQSEIAKAVQHPEVRGRLLDQGVEMVASGSPEECSAFIKSETEKYARIVREAGIRAE